MAERYYRSILVVEILGNEPYSGGLEAISTAVIDGGFSGGILAESSTEVTSEQISELLLMQGSEPEFLVTETD